MKAPAWQKVMPLGAEVRALALADDGDVYLAGTFEGTMRLGKNTLTSAGAADIFVTRFDVGTNTFNWAQQAGGLGKDVIRSLAVNHNQVYLAGYVGGSDAGLAAVAKFDTITLAARGTTSMFVAKIEEQDGLAHFGWVQGMAGVRSSEVQQLAVKNDNIYLAGSLDANDVYFGITRYKEGKALPRDSTRYHHAMYVARMSDAGADVKAVARLIIGFDRHHTFTGLVADAYPDVYLAGNFEKDPTTFVRTPNDKPGTGKATHLEAQIHKFTDADGKLQPIWDYTLGDSSETTVNALAVKADRLYAAGTFLKNTHFQGLRLATPAQAGYLVCLASDTYASPVWAVPLASPTGRAARCRATTLALHGSAVYVAGSYDITPPTTGQYATVSAQAKQLNAPSSNDIFISQFIDTGSKGQLYWQQVTTGGMVQAASLVTRAGPLYVAGSYKPAVQFGRLGLLGSAASSKRAFTGFWAELGPDKSKVQQAKVHD